MLFNSYSFLLIFLPIAISVYRIADDYAPARTLTLIALSLIFYGYWDVRFLPLMIASVLLNWAAARAFARTGAHSIIACAIAIDVLVLVFFKYTNFILENIAVLSGYTMPAPTILLPLGISFFTFHHIMYLVDLGRGRAPPVTLDRYALYICFFPQAIAGPIARWNEVIHQFGRKVFVAGWESRAAMGITFIVLGLFQKLILADPLGRAIDPLYVESQTGVVAAGMSWIALGFAFQVFYDFAGYTDIAIGLALIFGVTLPANFDAPYRKTSIVELWQSWHMTLARFLRDYVFQPLSRLKIGGSRHRLKRMLVALVLTMALGGLWHGAGWHFIIWGTLQGLALAVAASWRRYFGKMPALLGWSATITFFVLSGVFFRAETLNSAWNIFSGLATVPKTLSVPGINTLALAILCAVTLPSTDAICRWLMKSPTQRLAFTLGAATVTLLLVINAQDNYQFLYFQF